MSDGDLVTAITSIEDAMKGYDKGRKADTWRVDVTRRGTPMVLTWTLAP